MILRAIASAFLSAAFIGCSASRPPPPAAHSGWALRYTQRVGEGSATPRDVRPELALLVLDGAARINVRERGLEARVNTVHPRVELCRPSCTDTDEETAMLAIGGIEDLSAATGVREEPPQLERLDDPLMITNVPTQGARFTGALQSSRGALHFVVTVRWIEEPGDHSVEVVKDFFVAPLIRMGAAQLVEQIRRIVGLPLHWEVRITTRRADGSTGEGAVIYHAAELANPPAAL